MPVRSTEFVPMPASAKKAFALRLDPSLYAAVERLAAAELRSANAEIEVLLREALARRGVSVKRSDTPKRGRPPTQDRSPRGRRVGQEVVSTGGSRGLPQHTKKKKH